MKVLSNKDCTFKVQVDKIFAEVVVVDSGTSSSKKEMRGRDINCITTLVCEKLFVGTWLVYFFVAGVGVSSLVVEEAVKSIRFDRFLGAKKSMCAVY